MLILPYILAADTEEEEVGAAVQFVTAGATAVALFVAGLLWIDTDLHLQGVGAHQNHVRRLPHNLLRRLARKSQGPRLGVLKGSRAWSPMVMAHLTQVGIRSTVVESRDGGPLGVFTVRLSLATPLGSSW